MSIHTIDSLVLNAEEYGLLKKSQISGCNDEEIRLILQDQDTEYMPEQVEIFYRTMGKAAGELFIGEYILFPDILGKKIGYLKDLENAGSDTDKFRNALVFLNHHGYQYDLCLLGNGDERTYFYDDEMAVPRVEAADFFEFLDGWIKRIYDLRTGRLGIYR